LLRRNLFIYLTYLVKKTLSDRKWLLVLILGKFTQSASSLLVKTAVGGRESHLLRQWVPHSAIGPRKLWLPRPFFLLFFLSVSCGIRGGSAIVVPGASMFPSILLGYYRKRVSPLLEGIRLNPKGNHPHSPLLLSRKPLTTTKDIYVNREQLVTELWPTGGICPSSRTKYRFLAHPSDREFTCLWCI